MSDPNSETASDAAAITAGEGTSEQAVEQSAASEAAPLGGSQEEGKVQTSEAAASEAKAEEPAKTDESAKSEDSPDALSPLAKAAMKAAEKREKEEAQAKSEDEPEPVKAEEKSGEDPKAEEPAKTEAAKPEGDKPAETTEEKADDKPEEIKAEDVDKVHEKDSVSARDRIKALAATRDTLKAELDPLKETMEMLGGKEGVDEILNKVAIIEDPSKADEFLTLVEASPNFSAFKDKHFWSELDNPANQALIVADKFGDDYPLERLERLVELDKRGLIDTDAITAAADDPDLTDEQLKQKQASRTEANQQTDELAKLRKEKAERQTAEAQTGELNRWNEFGQGYDQELFPMLGELGIMPGKDDPPEIADAKTRHWGKIAMDAQKEFEGNPEFQEIAKLIKADATKTVTFRNKVRGFKPVYLDITKKAALKELPFLNGSIDAIYKQLGKPKSSAAAAAAAPAAPAAQAAAPPAAPAKEQELQTTAPEKATSDYRNATDRRNAFQKVAQRSAQGRGSRQ